MIPRMENFFITLEKPVENFTLTISSVYEMKDKKLIYKNGINNFYLFL